MENQYGTLPMGQGGATYRAISMQTDYFLELMKQNMLMAVDYAQTYGDIHNGMVTQYLAAAVSSAQNQGASIRQDAINSLVQAGVGAFAIGMTAVTAYQTRTGALDEKINDAKQMKGDLGAPSAKNLALEENEDQPGAPLKQPSKEIEEKIASWKQGGKALENYIPKKGGADRDAAIEQTKINRDAVEHLKGGPDHQQVSDQLDSYIKDLQGEKDELSQKFNNWINSLKLTQDTLTSGIQTPFNFKKAELTAKSQIEQAQASVLSQIQQKQSSFIDESKQRQSSEEQSADAIAAALAQIAQTRG